jgi:hypothetical protein
VSSELGAREYRSARDVFEEEDGSHTYRVSKIALMSHRRGGNAIISFERLASEKGVPSRVLGGGETPAAQLDWQADLRANILHWAGAYPGIRVVTAEGTMRGYRQPFVSTPEWTTADRTAVGRGTPATWEVASPIDLRPCDLCPRQHVFCRVNVVTGVVEHRRCHNHVGSPALYER